MTITNRADRSSTRRVELACRCPVAEAHPSDSAQVVTLFGYGERGQIRQAARTAGPEAGEMMIILLGVVSWTFTMPDGSERPITAEEVARLDERTVKDLLEALDEALDVVPLPKGRGRRSPGGSSARSSSRPTTLTPPRSMTA